MKAVRREGTGAELTLRDALDSYDLTYEVDAQPLPDLRRRADMLFRREKIAVFVDGCFWHSCPIHGSQAKSNARFWAEKIERNVERDRDTDRRLTAASWNVIRIWEHEDPLKAAETIESLIRRKQRSDDRSDKS